MSENKENNTPEPPKPSRPRREDGTFMPQVEIDKMKDEISKLRKESKDHLIEKNKALMHGTSFDDKYFKGMNSKQINQFLVNYHKQVKKKTEEAEPEAEPNTPILGTPIGSGTRKYFIDNYLDMKLKDNRPDINFDCPASIAFAKHENKDEALKKWLEPQ